MIITVVGSSGFLGKSIVKYFREVGAVVYEVGRDTILDKDINYGVVFYCAGVTAGYREKSREVIEAHIVKLFVWFQEIQFEHFVYFSSSRVYQGNESSDEEMSYMLVSLDDLYNQSKLIGERVCLSYAKSVTVLRVSNVVGYEPFSPYFIWDIMRRAKNDSCVQLMESKSAGRDYIDLDTFLTVMHLVSHRRISGIYNLSSGSIMQNVDLLSVLSEIKKIDISYGNASTNMPKILNNKIQKALDVSIPLPDKYIKSLFERFLKQEV